MQKSHQLISIFIMNKNMSCGGLSRATRYCSFTKVIYKMSRHLYNLRITRIIHLFRRVSRSPLLIRHSFTPIYTTQGTLMCSSSNSHSIFSHSKHKTAVSADENDFWEPVYRLHPIVFIQAVSRFKLLLSGIMLIGCPVTIYGM
ncbi:unnamed protein product [Heterobilharzia americana]|nr:unnamed protein product [Heterobilharzia americana]